LGQHYVARFYLKAWTDEGMLYRLNRTTGVIKKKGLGGVANEKLFYRLSRLTSQEIEFLDGALLEPCPEPLRSMQRQFLKLYTLAPNLRAKLTADQLDPNTKALLDDEIAMSGERHHSRIEGCLKPLVDLMLSGNTSFLSDPRRAADFLYAICIQFTRTKRAREAAIRILGTKYQGCDPKRIWDVSSHIVATSVARSLYVDRGGFRIVLVDNATATPFITADQPIINIHDAQDGRPPDKLEYYYPLSPSKAMFYLEAQNARCYGSNLSELAVNNFNILMMKNSYEQVYSDSAEYLEMIRRCDL